MLALLFMPSSGGDASSVIVAPKDQATIVFLLLLLLGSVLVIGAALAVVIRRHLRRRGTTNFVSGGKRSLMELRGVRALPPAIFHCPNRWLAIKSANLRSIQATLGLHNPTPCSWTEGIACVSDQKLFVSPPVNGWILVIGTVLPEPGEDVDACFRFLQRLSRAVGELQFFSVNQTVGHHAWARFEDGRVIRGYAWAGETLWNQGVQTRAERKLGLKCYDYFETDMHSHFTQLERARANTEKVPLLAAVWSVDPGSVNDNALADVFGIAGDLSPAKLR